MFRPVSWSGDGGGGVSGNNKGGTKIILLTERYDYDPDTWSFMVHTYEQIYVLH